MIYLMIEELSRTNRPTYNNIINSHPVVSIIKISVIPFKHYVIAGI
jgi:hypothetical protein